jgi:ABC-2 type transport system ATP-binding protein
VTDNAIVQFEDINKHFGKTMALKEISFDISPGRIIGLIGANGSGKSTLIRHIIGLYLPTTGSCRTFGSDAANISPENLARIGYVHQEGELMDWMRVSQLIDFVSAYYDNWNPALVEKFIREFDIPLKTRVGKLSPGKRQQVAILLAVAYEPELLILDEPAAGLDPIARARFLDMLIEIIQDENRTILISSHILSDIEKIVDHIMILDEGKLLRDCEFDTLREEFTRVRLTCLDKSLPDTLSLPGVLSYVKNTHEAVAILQHQSTEEIQRLARDVSCSAEISPLSLEEIYRAILKM